MTDYYVADSDGSDAYNGLFASFQSGSDGPWKTVGYAVNQVSAADTIHVRVGTYSESVNMNSANNGSNGSPITLQRYQSEVVTIDGGTEAAIAHSSATGFTYWTFKNMTLTGGTSTNKTIDIYNTSTDSDNLIFDGVIINGSILAHASYSTFQDCIVTQTGAIHPDNGMNLHGQGTSGSRGANNTVDGCTVSGYDIRGVWLQGRANNCTVTNNTVYDIGTGGGTGMGIDADGDTHIVWEHTITGNTIYNCGESAIQMENAYACIVEENTIYSCGDVSTSEAIQFILYSTGETGGGYGIAGDNRGNDSQNICRQNLIYDQTGFGVRNINAGGVLIYGNTIVNSSSFALYFDAGAASYTPLCEVVGNILHLNGTGGDEEIGVSDDITVLAVDEYNVINHSGDLYAKTAGPFTGYTLAEYQAATVNGDTNDDSDPLLMDVAGDDYHLKSSSPAIELVPFDQYALTNDFDGIPRNRGTKYDAGCYETLKGGPRGL